MKKPTLLVALLVLLVPAVLVYFGVAFYADHQLRRHEESLGPHGRAAMAYVVQVNQLRLDAPHQSLENIAALVSPPLPPGFTLRRVAPGEREKFPWLKDSDYLVQQSGPPHLVIPSAAHPVNIDLGPAPGAPATPGPETRAAGAKAK